MCTRLSLMALSRSTTSKATQPSATLSEWSPLICLTSGSFLTSKSHNIRVRPLQTESAVQASEKPADMMVANLKLAKVTLKVQNLMPGGKKKVSDKLWDPLVFSLKEVNPQEGVKDGGCSWLLSSEECDRLTSGVVWLAMR